MKLLGKIMGWPLLFLGLILSLISILVYVAVIAVFVLISILLSTPYILLVLSTYLIEGKK